MTQDYIYNIYNCINNKASAPSHYCKSLGAMSPPSLAPVGPHQQVGKCVSYERVQESRHGFSRELATKGGTKVKTELHLRRNNMT